MLVVFAVEFAPCARGWEVLDGSVPAERVNGPLSPRVDLAGVGGAGRGRCLIPWLTHVPPRVPPQKGCFPRACPACHPSSGPSQRLKASQSLCTTGGWRVGVERGEGGTPRGRISSLTSLQLQGPNPHPVYERQRCPPPPPPTTHPTPRQGCLL